MLVQDQRAWWDDNYIKKNVFQPRDWAPLYDSKFKHFKGKFSTRWLGPYEVEEVFDNGFVRIKNIDAYQTPFCGEWPSTKDIPPTTLSSRI